MGSLGRELRLSLDRVAFAQSLGLTPDPWQRDLLSTTSRRTIINASRQSGKSTTTAVMALHRALYHPGSLILLLAPALRQSQELFSKLAGFYKELGRPVPAHGERRLSLELENGSRVVTLPGTERTIRGFSGAALLVVDEASRIDGSLYHALRPMLAVSGGALILLSTPFGRRGIFYDTWINGFGWERYEVPATQVPRITPEFLEAERRALPAWVYRQEYECSFEETEDAVFMHEHVQAALDPDVEPLILGGIDG